MAQPTVRNVLFITADQWRGDTLGAVGHPCVKTPNLDRLAADGVLFSKHYAQGAPCAPSRASLLTGLYMFNHRVVYNGPPLDRRFTNVALEARKRAAHDRDRAEAKSFLEDMARQETFRQTQHAAQLAKLEREEA